MPLDTLELLHIYGKHDVDLMDYRKDMAGNRLVVHTSAPDYRAKPEVPDKRQHRTFGRLKAGVDVWTQPKCPFQ